MLQIAEAYEVLVATGGIGQADVSVDIRSSLEEARPTSPQESVDVSAVE
jgi:hypothetical protein